MNRRKSDMQAGLFKSLAMDKYERLLTRLFPDHSRLEIRDVQGMLVWQPAPTDAEADGEITLPDGQWQEVAPDIERCQSPEGEIRFRGALRSHAATQFAWLYVCFDTRSKTPITAAPNMIVQAFAAATPFLQDEIELQAECNELATELTERYEELNLVYATNQQLEQIEESQDALSQLIHNCVDYLDVGMAVLICRERDLCIHSAKNTVAPIAVEALLGLLTGGVYDHVVSQLDYLVINESDDPMRQTLLANRDDRLLAQPVLDDHGSAIGILAVIDQTSAQIFSNGDKNLLAVMAKKVSRVIHIRHDSLTGLKNRTGFEATLVAALMAAKSRNRRYCFLHVDIDQLHVVNDLLGHHEGDALIRRVARALQSCVRDSDEIGRLDGDEFAVILADCGVEQARVVAQKISDAVAALKVMSANRQLDVSASIGVASIDLQTGSLVSLMANAEIACKAAKEAGRSEIRVFADDDVALVRRSAEVEWIGRIQGALQEDEFRLYCQPVVPLKDSSASPHFEILIRLQDGDDVLSPVEFLPAAERYQLMPQIDRWVVRNTLKALDAVWDAVAMHDPVFCLNLSGQSLTNTGFQAFVLEQLERSAVPSHNVCFEITETCAIANIDEATAFMQQIKDTGSKFSLDDFGAGLSSFGYLRMLPVDYLKIDGSFIRDIVADNVSRAMVEAICQIAVTMGLRTVAEFVGDEPTVQLLDGIGVDYVQGFHVGKPAPFGELLDELRSCDRATSA